jgi:hypothetical protein
VEIFYFFLREKKLSFKKKKKNKNLETLHKKKISNWKKKKIN